MLIIGAGSGNDVAAALAHGAGHVDAVEIDPVINELGRLYHPNRPYSDPRVSIHLDDGRSFVRKTPSQYDLISYAVVDSLALHSSYSSVRLESFLFTEQAFRDIKAKLKPGGVFAMYNFYRQGWVVGRLVKLGETVFGSRPLVVSLPYQDVISRDNNQRDYITFLLVRRRHVAGRRSDPVEVRVRAVLLAQSGAEIQFGIVTASDRRLRSCAGDRAHRVHEDRAGRGRADGRSTESRPTTGRSSTFASRRSPRSTCAAWRSWRCSRS